ncbi:MAG: diguanylate cyclase [Moorea sp. SIO2B7]|nr:diguanylate cyclase [Moorena sp. SIO2B7]
MILSNTDKEGVIALTEKIQKAIRLEAITHEKSEVSNIVSVSLGIACIIPKLESSPEELIYLADQALYKAKEEGRDRYKIRYTEHLEKNCT